MTNRRSARARIPLVLVLGCAPVAAFVWLGCSSDDDDTGSSVAAVSPGGTWGAEIDVTVVGRGRVTTSTNDVDCPSGACFGKYIFASNTADGATGGIVLTATPTPGAKFLGWSFTPDPLGSRGTGPDPCNPVIRAASLPQVNATALQITLPYGQIAGTPSDGGTACGAYANVPLAYHVVATFDATVTAQPDGAPLDSGSPDGGAATIAYNIPGATQIRDLGLAEGTLYFHYTEAGEEIIAEGADPEFDSNTTPTTITASASTITTFKVFSSGVIYQAGGTVSVIRANSFTATQLTGSTSCNAIALDEEGNAYCHTTTGSILTWSFPSYTTPATLWTNVSLSNDLTVDGFSTLLFDTSNAIETLPITGADAGTPTPTQLVSASSPSHLAVGASRYGYVSASTQVFVTSSKFAPTTATNTNVSGIGTILNLVADPFSSTFFYAFGTSGIAHADSFGTESKTVLSASLQSGTTDGEYVFYTIPGDPKIYRGSALAQQ